MIRAHLCLHKYRVSYNMQAFAGYIQPVISSTLLYKIYIYIFYIYRRILF